MRFPFPLVRDRRADRTTPVAAVELTETDLRTLASVLHGAATREAEGARTDVDRLFAQALHGESNRFKRVADELRVATRIHKDGAAPADTGPRHDPREEVLS